MKLNRGEPDHSHWKTPFTPKEKATAWLGLGACVVLLGVMEWTNPSNPPFTTTNGVLPNPATPNATGWTRLIGVGEDYSYRPIDD